MKPIGGIVLLAAAGVLLSGCGGTVTPPPSATSSRPMPSVSALPTTTTTIPTSDPEELIGWVGQYSFSEILGDANEPPAAAMGYGIAIYEMGTGFFAAITLSGYGATQSIMATVQGDDTTVTLYFNAYIGANPWKNAAYAVGDELLTMTKGEDGKITTTWSKMKPQVASNNTPGPHFTFVTPSPSK